MCLIIFKSCVHHVRAHVYAYIDLLVNQWTRSMLRFQLEQHAVIRGFRACLGNDGRTHEG